MATKEMKITDPLAPVQPEEFETDTVQKEDDEIQDDADNGEGQEILEDETEGTEEDAEESEEGDLIEDEDEGGGSNPLALDPKVAAKLTPEERKRYDEQAAGLNKLRTQLETKEKGLANLSSWDAAFNDKTTVVDALKQFASNIVRSHGLDLSDVFPQSKAKADEGKTEDDGFEYDTDRKVYEKAKADSLAEVDKKLKETGMDAQTLKDFKEFIQSQKTGAEKAKADAERSTYVDDILPRVMNTLKARFDGFKPDEKAVRAALLKGDPKKPIQTVKTALVDDLIAHTAKRAKTQAGPERLHGNSAAGKALSTDPLKASALDYVK